MRSSIAATVLLLLSLGLCAPGDKASRHSRAFIWGVGVHLMNGLGNDSKVAHLRDLGFTAFRDDALWARAEKKPNHYEVPAAWEQFVAEAVAKGIRPLLILDYGNPLYDQGKRPKSRAAIAAFANYARFLARHFKESQPIYEIWNEWHMESGEDVREYVALLAATYHEIKKADPRATVVGGSFGVRGVSALATFVRLGAMRHLDGLSVHPYVQCELARGPEGYMSLVTTMAQLAQTDARRPLYITEMGWPTHRGRCGITEDQAASHLAASYLIARCLRGVAGFWWYDLRDDGSNPAEMEQNFGLLSVDFRPKKAGLVAREIGALNGSLRCKQPIDSSPHSALYEFDGRTMTFAEMMKVLLRQQG
jgi:polysaccharide biosynthesis protein PslG